MKQPSPHAVACGKRVRDKRIALGMSQHTLAVAVGYTQSAIWRIETGNTLPSDHARVRIAAALGSTAEELWPYPSLAEAEGAVA